MPSLTNSVLVLEPNAGKTGGGCGASDNECSCTHGDQINFGDLTPYLTYAPHPASLIYNVNKIPVATYQSSRQQVAPAVRIHWSMFSSAGSSPYTSPPYETSERITENLCCIPCCGSRSGSAGNRNFETFSRIRNLNRNKRLV